MEKGFPLGPCKEMDLLTTCFCFKRTRKPNVVNRMDFVNYMFLFQADKKTKRGQQNGFVNQMFLFQADKKTKRGQQNGFVNHMFGFQADKKKTKRGQQIHFLWDLQGNGCVKDVSVTNQKENHTWLTNHFLWALPSFFATENPFSSEHRWRSGMTVLKF